MSEIQSVVFIKDKSHPWTIIKAKQWLKKHDLKLLKGKKVDKVPNKEAKTIQLRFRIKDPKQYKRFATKKIEKDNINLIIGFKSSP